jgi:glycosyltransferase involved in cell wall biosynthesis
MRAHQEARKTKLNVPLSILVPIKNEARNLSRCLEALRWADEIVVIDSQSTDGSREIARQFGAKVVQFEFGGSWPKKKNWGLANIPFRNEWVFLLDADEVMPREAEAELRGIVSAGANGIAGYWVNRRFMFMGKWLRHAYYPNWNLRLIRHRLGRFEKITDLPTASGDNEVHEHLRVQGPTARLKFELDHYAFPSVDVFVEKHNRYSNWEARVALDPRAFSGTEGGPQDAAAARRRRLKLLAYKLPARPWLRFLHIFFWQRGFLDGWEGYYFARLHAFYEFLSVAKTFEARKSLREIPASTEYPAAEKQPLPAKI